MNISNQIKQLILVLKEFEREGNADALLSPNILIFRISGDGYN